MNSGDNTARAVQARICGKHACECSPDELTFLEGVLNIQYSSRGQVMDAATLNAFCAVKELTFVETVVRSGTKGAWFEDRKRVRKFFAENEVNDAVRRMSPIPPLFMTRKSPDAKAPAA